MDEAGTPFCITVNGFSPAPNDASNMPPTRFPVCHVVDNASTKSFHSRVGRS